MMHRRPDNGVKGSISRHDPQKVCLPLRGLGFRPGVEEGTGTSRPVWSHRILDV